MVDTFNKQQPCRSDTVASDFVPLFAQLSTSGSPAPLDVGLVALVAKINTPQFRRLHPTRR